MPAERQELLASLVDLYWDETLPAREEIEVNVIFAPPGEDVSGAVERLADLGVSRLMVPAFAFAGDGGLERLAAFGDAVVASAA